MSALTDSLEVQSALLNQIYARLTEKRNLIEREVLRYGEAPSGVKQVFELCRGFERAYVSFVNESAIAGKVKEAFMGEKGLAGVVMKLPLEKVFELPNVKAVCRYADGYQPHLVSPDNGIHALCIEALDLVRGPVHNCVQAVHALLTNAAREAAEKAGEHTEGALIGTSLPMYVPEFKTVIMPAIAEALDEWMKDADKMAMMLVDMERSYITAGFFRHIMTHRMERIQLHDSGQQSGASQPPPRQSADPYTPAPVNAGNKSLFPAFGAKDPAAINDGASDGSDEAQGQGKGPANLGNASDFVAAYFEKSGSNDGGFTQALSALRWQRRFFIFSDSQKMLYYFKSPEDVPKPNGLRGQVNIGECLIDDLDDRGQPRHPGSAPATTADKAHWVIRIRHKDAAQNVVKEHKTMVLRAEGYQAKVEWLNRLRRATGEAKPKTLERPSKAPGAKLEQSGSPFSSEGAAAESASGGGGGSGGSGPSPAPARTGKSLGDLSWAQEAEPILDTHLGQGAKMFRADSIRDADGRLPPAPRVLLNPMRIIKDSLTPGASGSFEAQYDALLGQIGSDANMYMRMVCDTICTTVPKAVVHSLIRKSEKNLIERLFNIIHKLTPEQMEQLLKEEDVVVERRMQARKVFEDVKSAVFQVHEALSKKSTSADDPDNQVSLQVNVFAYAGMPEYLTSEQRSYFDKLFSDPISPETMRFWASASAQQLPPPPNKQQPDAAGASPASSPQPQQRPPGQPRPPPPPQQQQQQQQQPQATGLPYRTGPPPPGQLGAALGPIPGAPRPGAPPPPVPMRPAPGAAPPPVRRAPPPPPTR